MCVVANSFIVAILMSLTCIPTNLATSKYFIPECSDYEMLMVNTKQCVSRCPIVCENGVCYEDGICPCEGYYENSPDCDLTCVIECFPGCRSAGGYCATPDLCLCQKGYYFNKVLRVCLKNTIHLFQDRCRGQCLYGTCTSNGECICAQGYAFRAVLFGQLCTPICRQNCGPNGYCFAPNMCACRKKHHHYGSDGKCHKDPNYLGEPLQIQKLLHGFLKNKFKF